MPRAIVLPPDDVHNRRLIAEVHPPDWVNPEPAGPYNMVVIGGGTAGLVTAAGAAGLGARVALVERHLMGGDCLNSGCVPSKALLAAARTASQVRHAAGYGILTGEVSVDFAAVMERMRRLRAGIAPHDAASRFRDLGVDVFLGEGRFTGRRSLEVSGRSLTFSRACIATGGRPAAPPVPGLEEAGYFTSDTIFSLTELPRRLAIIGAGPIGCEMAQAFARFGSLVALIETEHGILPREDADAAALVREALERDGVQILCCGRQLTVAGAAAGAGPGMGAGARLVVDSHERSHQLEVDGILVATGRKPNLDGLGLQAAGVESTDRGVVVNDRLQTGNRRIFAAGDVCSPYAFTHAADAMARIVVQNALFSFLPVKARASALTMPWCTYTDPELAHVGLSLRQLEEGGRPFETLTLDMADVDRAILEEKTQGLLKVHLVRGKDRILGATLVGSHAGEIISEITLGMVHGLGLKAYSATIHPYPTQAEILRRAGDVYKRRALTPRLKKILGRIMAWQR